MAEDSDLERTESASSRRLEQAREEGQVPQSRELMSFMVLLASVGGFWMLGSWLTQRASDIVRRGLSFGHEAAFDVHIIGSVFGALSWNGMMLAAPVFLLCIGAALVTPFLLGSWIISPKALEMDFSRLDPIKGMGRMFSVYGLGELVKAVLKAVLVGVVIYWIVLQEQGNLFSLMGQSVTGGLASFAQMLMFSSLALVGGVAFIAALDVPFQLWQYYKNLRMTKEELRQEFKESEGDPQVKARIRSQQREMARKRMMSEVPKADVVVTNPSHYAVALRYDRNTMGAPQVVAKGMNVIAEKIRELAEEHGVPLLEAPPLARALYRHSDIGDQIPAQLYTAVAEVMAYVYQLGRFMAGEANIAEPLPPETLPVPPDMDPGVLE